MMVNLLNANWNKRHLFFTKEIATHCNMEQEAEEKRFIDVFLPKANEKLVAEWFLVESLSR